MACRRLLIAVSVLFAWSSWLANTIADDRPDFERQIAPLLVSNCLDCHQPNKRSGKLNLSTWEGLLTGGEQGPAIALEKPLSSLLLERVMSGEMPPPEQKAHAEQLASQVSGVKKVNNNLQIQKTK